MLNRQRCDPEIICWDGGVLASQLAVEFRVNKGCRFVGIKDLNPWLVQEANQDLLVLRDLCPAAEPSPKFRQDNIGVVQSVRTGGK